MTTPAVTATAPLDARLQAIDTAIADAKDEIRAADTKTGILLTVATLIVGGLVTYAGTRLNPAAAIFAWAAAIAAGHALVTLLLVILPRLSGAQPGQPFPDHQALLDSLDVPAEDREARLRLFSTLAVAKHYRVRLAVQLLLASVVLLAIAALAAAV